MRIQKIHLVVAAFTMATNVTAINASPVTPDKAEMMTVIQKGKTPQERLMEGNRRFVEDRLQRPNQSPSYRRALAKGQLPFAMVICCFDSRVQPMLIFDAGIGDLMILTSPANICEGLDFESMEYASGHLNVPLILVLGHERCGAMTAAVEANGKPGAHLRRIVASLSAAVTLGGRRKGDRVHNCTEENVRKTVREIRTQKLPNSPQVVPAMYDLESGKVTILTE